MKPSPVNTKCPYLLSLDCIISSSPDFVYIRETSMLGDPFMLWIFTFISKLDGVGPVDYRPSTDKLHQFVKKKIQFIHNTWQLTSGERVQLMNQVVLTTKTDAGNFRTATNFFVFQGSGQLLILLWFVNRCQPTTNYFMIF